MLKITTTAAAAAIAALLSSSAGASSVTSCVSVRGGTVCESIVTADPAPVEASPRRGSATAETVSYDPIEAARVLAIPKHDPNSSPLCPAPWRMTARDGCQR